MPQMGDIVNMHGMKVQAYDPDGVCQVEISIKSNFLGINSNGDIVVTKSLSKIEFHSLENPLVVELMAIEKSSGNSEVVPLILSFSF